EMHLMVNTVQNKIQRVEDVLASLENNGSKLSVVEELKTLHKSLKAWDEDMIQRRSKAYDDVENFENKFTAEYLFPINHNDNSIPMINQPSKDQKKILDEQWKLLKNRGEDLLNNQINQMNKKLWSLEIGAI
ncbi:MAG TPA: glycosyl hydrolase, partial [Saprospiraceae bacterium]|nr:glycosyl hydrolase [Saprospiraceae bacterium]